MSTSKLIAFDLEGPLSPQDNAYEVMGLTENGYEVFERLSRYDDILALESRPDYEPGDTLYLVLPFLFAENIKSEDVYYVSEKASLTPGAVETIKALKEEKIPIVIISTSYEPHAINIGRKVGISKDLIACTAFPFTTEINIPKEEKETIISLKKKLLTISLSDNEALKRNLDEFYLKVLPSMSFYSLISNIRVIGGRRKVNALREFMEKFNVKHQNTVCVGDSITDFHMLDYINKNKGVAIVFNGNEYAIPYATVAVASETVSDIIKPIKIFFNQCMDALKEFIRAKSDLSYTLIEECKDINSLISFHKNMRKKIRGRAGQLG